MPTIETNEAALKATREVSSLTDNLSMLYKVDNDDSEKSPTEPASPLSEVLKGRLRGESPTRESRERPEGGKWEETRGDLLRSLYQSEQSYATGIRWERLSDVKRSETGAAGVYFIRDGQREVIMKASESPVEEAFLTLLTSRFDIATPRLEIVHPTHEQYERISQSIKPFIEIENRKVHEAKELEPENELVQERMPLELEKRPCLYFMEKIEGTSLVTQEQGERLRKLFVNEEKLSPTGEQFFEDMGKLVVFDLAIRNGDRLDLNPHAEKLGFESNENPGNVMISDQGKMIAIDPLKSETSDSDITDLPAYLREQRDDLANIGKDALYMTGFKMSDQVEEQARAHLLAGIDKSINLIADRPIFQAILNETRNNIQRQIPDGEMELNNLIQELEKI